MVKTLRDCLLDGTVKGQRFLGNLFAGEAPVSAGGEDKRKYVYVVEDIVGSGTNSSRSYLLVQFEKPAVESHRELTQFVLGDYLVE